MNKSELAKGFKITIEDLLDNYDQYTDEEKDQIKEIFVKASELNKILDKYDIETRFDWNECFGALGEYLDPMRYNYWI